MSMVFCTVCGGKIADTAPLCPHCGAPQRSAFAAHGGFAASGGHGRGFGEAIKICFSKYADFSGRAPRSEYWWWVLFGALLGAGVGAVAGMVDAVAGTKIFVSIADIVLSLGLLLPNLAVAVRRLHDLNRSGWWLALLYGLLLALLVVVIVLAASIEANHAHGDGAHPPGSAALALLTGILALATLGVDIMFLVWLCTRGTPGPNRFGPDPLV